VLVNTERDLRGENAVWSHIMAFRLLAAVAISSQLIASSVSAEEVLLRISLHQPASGPIGQNLMEFKRGVEKRTGGALKVRIYDKAEFYLDYQVPEAVGSGAIEMGVAPLAQYAADIPAAGLFMQPFLFNSDSIVRASVARRSEIRSAIDAEIERKAGVRVLWWQPYGANVILANGPLANPDAIVDRKVRVFDEVSAEFVKLCGGTPHIISDAKQAEAFDLKIVDASIASIASLSDNELWRKIDTITNIRHSENLFLVVMNANTFDSLTPQQQKDVMAAAQNAEDIIWKGFGDAGDTTYALAFAAAKGIKVQQLTPDDTVAWRVCSSSILESYRERASDLGLKLFQAYGRLRANTCCSREGD
jgi:C4-dicarboxylate-binding protein DctP